MGITLRPQQPGNLAVLTGGESPFDDFGPRATRTAPSPPGFDAPGALSVIAEDGEVAGEVQWHWEQWGPNAASRCPMIGIWLRAEYRGRGIGSAAQSQIVELLFRHTTANRVEAHADVENVAEQRALEAAGFRREGVIRGAQWRDGQYRDGLLTPSCAETHARGAVSDDGTLTGTRLPR